MRVTTRGQYGIKALFELAMRVDKEPVPLREIAMRQNLPENYLEQLMAPLRKAGLVRSVRGAQGGYLLARDPELITIGDILRVLEGPVSLADGLIDSAEDGEDCVISGVWRQVQDAINNVIDNITLAQLREQELLRREKQAYIYHI